MCQKEREREREREREGDKERERGWDSSRFERRLNNTMDFSYYTAKELIETRETRI